MDQKDLVELLKYSSPYSILVVTYDNELVELFCPFIVFVKQDIGDLIRGDKASVIMVKLSSNLKTVFVIEDNAYYYFYFDILI